MPKENQRKSYLIISYGPIPTAQYQKIEGGGMRAWGLARGLELNGQDVTIGINASFPQEVSSIGDIKLVNWSADEQFAQLINSYDIVIVSYCMGSDSVFIANNIKDDVLLVLDAYVPIYVEVSARNADDMATELGNYLQDIQRFNKVLKRGDYFLCANEAQKVFYTGVLGSLGVINPRSYSEHRLLVVPFGIHDEPTVAVSNPYLELGISAKDRVVLWFGGLYPWFKAEDYLDAIRTLSAKDSLLKFVFVGGKNPFNNNPNLLKQYTKTVEFAKEQGLINKSVFFVDWVDFDTRSKWYKYADFVVSLNQPGEENGFSWRTRVMDYVWGEVVTVTNGGDPLGEELLASGAAIKLPSLKSKEIVKTIENIYLNPNLLKSAKHNLKTLKPNYYWQNTTKPIIEAITYNKLPYHEELEFMKQHHITEELAINSRSRKIKLAMHAPRKLLRKAKEKGIKKSAKLAIGIAKTQISNRSRVSGRQFIFLSHPIDNTGAPLVLMQILDEVSAKFGGKNIRLITPKVTRDNRRKILERGVTIQKSAHALSPRLTGAQLGIRRGDFVLINTVAIYDNYRTYVFNLLLAGKLDHAYWFIHEDIDQLKVVAPHLTKNENVKKIQKLVKDNKITILVPSEQVKEDYENYYSIENVVVVPLKVDVGEYNNIVPKDESYKEINFMLSGTPSDGRKGQLIALAAFSKFIDINHSVSPDLYRIFTLHFVGIGNDYVSTQVKSIGHAILGNKLRIYPPVSRDKALEITSKCNAVICCSLNETFALYVAEGMAMGHVVLRNASAGMKEQLIDGKNGYFIDSNDINQFAEVIEKILNKRTSDSKLKDMGKKSQQIIGTYSKNSYLESLGL